MKDLKQSCNPRQMKKHIFGRITGPIIVLAVHLCGTLSIKAVDMFNNNDNVKLFALKPCCLPKMVYANRGDIFKLGNHEFDAKDVCSNGAFNKKNWDGPPRWHLQVTDYTGRLFVLHIIRRFSWYINSPFLSLTFISLNSICGHTIYSRESTLGFRRITSQLTRDYAEL